LVGASEGATIVDMGTDSAGLEILDREECLRLLASTQTGRIAISVKALPVILPVRFALVDHRIVIRTHVGSTLESATCGAVVAFETDGTEPAANAEWSVLATGIATHVTDEQDLARLADLTLPRWTMGSDRLLAISTDQLAGRRAISVGARQPAARPLG
jgi:hypothetical protein